MTVQVRRDIIDLIDDHPRRGCWGCGQGHQGMMPIHGVTWSVLLGQWGPHSSEYYTTEEREWYGLPMQASRTAVRAS